MSNQTDNYTAFIAYAKDYFERHNIKVSFSYTDIVHDILIAHPKLGLEDQMELFNKFLNKEKKGIRRIGMCERDMDRERIAAADAQVEFKNDPVKNARNKKGKNKWHSAKRKNDGKWAHNRDIKNNKYKKDKYKNDPDYRLNKKKADHKYYLKKHSKPIDNKEISTDSVPSVKTTCREHNTIEKMKNNSVNIINPLSSLVEKSEVGRKALIFLVMISKKEDDLKNKGENFEGKKSDYGICKFDDTYFKGDYRIGKFAAAYFMSNYNTGKFADVYYMSYYRVGKFAVEHFKNDYYIGKFATAYFMSDYTNGKFTANSLNIY